MNRWKGDARKQVETAYGRCQDQVSASLNGHCLLSEVCSHSSKTPENAGGKADSEDSSFGSALSKKTKSDVRLRTNQGLKVENLPTSALKQSMSQNNEARIPMEAQQDRNYRNKSVTLPGEALFREKQVFVVPQKGELEAVSQEQVFDMHYIRETILEQEAVFREQVRELHRVHKVQTLLMAEMRKKDSDLILRSSGTNVGGPCQSPTGFLINSGRWNSAVGQVFNATGKGLDTSTSLPELLKGGSTIVQRDMDMSRPPHEENLFKQNARLPPGRRTFDLERPPEDDDDDEQPEHKDDESFKPEGNCIKFMESPVSGKSELESDISLNLSTGWSRGKGVKDNREHSSKADHEISRSAKRPREEAALFPFLTTKSESLQDAPLRPTATMATQSFLGGLWGLQLGRQLDSSSTDGNGSPEYAEVPKKKERHSLNLEVEDKALPAIPPNGTPHWLLKAPAAKPSKKAVCQTESSSLNFQHSVSPPRNSSEQGMMTSFPPQSRGESGSGSAPGFWSGERQVSDNPPPMNRSQASHNARRLPEEDVQGGMRSVYQAPVGTVSSTASVGVGYGPFKLAQGVGEAPREALTLYSSWREVGEVPCNSFSHGVLTQNQALAGGFGVQLRSFEGHPGITAQGLVQVGSAVNIGAGSATFVPESGSGLWYQQRNLNPLSQQYQQQQQLASHQTGVSSSHHGHWQGPTQISQGTAYGQGTVYAIPTAAGPSLGFPMDGLGKVGDNLPGPNWTSGSVGPPFTPFSIVAPPKPPFKRPPKLVLTHDGTTMELKLVSPDREVAAKVVTEKSFSGSSDEEVGEKRGKGSADGSLNQGQVKNEKDASLWPRGRRDREKRASITSLLKEKSSPASAGAPDWMVAKVLSSAAHKIPQAGRNGVQHPPATVVAMDDADGGSSDAGSGGSGVGDVINPGDHASPSLGSFAAGGPNRYLPAGEGEEGVNMGELGLQADSESHSDTFNRRPLQEKPRKHQEELQEQLSASLGFRSGLSMTTRKISRVNLDGSGHVVDNTKKRGRGIEGLSEEAEERAPVSRRVVDQSASSGTVKNLLDKYSHSNGLGRTQQSLGELRDAQLELQQPISLTSQPRLIHTSNSQDSEKQGKESSKGAESFSTGHGSKVLRDQYVGRVAMDSDDTDRGKTEVDQRNISLSNFGDVYKQERESKADHSKQLSGASTSEKDVVQHKPYSPALRQIPNPSSRVDVERHAGGSSTKVSQASETVQGNGRSPLRASEWIGPTSRAQGYSCSTGGIDSSCEEVDGTLMKGLRQDKTKHKGKDVSPGGIYSGSLSHKDLGQDAAMDLTDPSYGMGISTTTKASQYPTGDSTPGRGTIKRRPTSVKPKSIVWGTHSWSKSISGGSIVGRECYLYHARCRECCFCIPNISQREGRSVI